ncbi:MAG: adenosylmethionine decarboxylase [bacterium]
MKPLGSQLIAEFIGCSEGVLNDSERLEAILTKGIESCGMTLVGVSSHQFDPVGVTVVAIIGESHVVIHTYPEANHASIDIFTCADGPTSRGDLLDHLRDRLSPVTMRVVDLERGNPLDIKETDWITCFSACGYETRYHVESRVFSKRSKYQQIDIIANESFGRMLFLDRDLQISEKDGSVYNRRLVAPVIRENETPGRVAILGGGDGGVLHDLLAFGPESVVLVDIDRDVIDASRRYLRSICGESFEHPDVTVVIEDANEFLDRESGFDAIIYDLTMFPEALTHTDRTDFLRGVFSRIRGSLRPGGIVSIQCCSEFDNDSRELLNELLPALFVDVEFDAAFVPSFCEKWVFASARVARHADVMPVVKTLHSAR